jgi:hypothetical protein
MDFHHLQVDIVQEFRVKFDRITRGEEDLRGREREGGDKERRKEEREDQEELSCSHQELQRYYGSITGCCPE